MPSLLLASGSPRRAHLLADGGFRFQTVHPAIAERFDQHLTARELTAWNAVGKGLRVARRHPKKVILAADTVVVLHDKIIGKPTDFSDAVRILRRLSGRTHHVYSSVFIAHLAKAQVKLFCEMSQVRFRKLSEAQIRSYLAKIDPLDKAGAYAAQGHGTEIIARIDGSYSNVVGLPMEQTAAALKQFGIRQVRPARRRSPFRVRRERAREGDRGARSGKGTRR